MNSEKAYQNILEWCHVSKKTHMLCAFILCCLSEHTVFFYTEKVLSASHDICGMHREDKATCNWRRDRCTGPPSLCIRHLRVTGLRTVNRRVRDPVVTGARLSLALEKTSEGA